MSIQKFYAAIEAPHVQTITLASVDLAFEPKSANLISSDAEDGIKYKAFLNDDDLAFIIFELEDSCAEIGIPIDGIAQNYKILSFYHADGRNDYLLNTIIKNDYGVWEEHNFLITVQ